MARSSTCTLSGAFLWGLVTFSAQAQSSSSGLSEGTGREMVTGVCTACHQISQITRSSGYTVEGWKELTSTMIDLSANPQQQHEIVHYLAEHLPPND